MKNILFAFFLLPLMAQAQILPPLPPDVTVTDMTIRVDSFGLGVTTTPRIVTGDGSAFNPFGTISDTAFSPIIFGGQMSVCNSYISDTTEIEICSDGSISISRIKSVTDTSNVNRNYNGYYYSLQSRERISTLRLKDPTGLLFKAIQENNDRVYMELHELRNRVQIYEAFYGIIKGRPYQNGDCIEMLPPTQVRTPCEPKAKPPVKKSPRPVKKN